MPRPSPVTDAVRDLFASRERHSWSLDELHAGAVDRLGGADFSTVFRAVGQLEREGLVARIEVGDGRPRYELRDGHHEHVRCEGCGRVAAVPGCALDDVAASVEASTGFVVSSHQLLFTGLCPDCAA